MNGSSNPDTDYMTTLFGKWRKDKELALTLFDSLSTLPAADGTGTRQQQIAEALQAGIENYLAAH